jgi:secreted Zn-dependent insulinase-like peptidase
MPKLNAALDVFAHVVREPFFDQLRTKQQLGYLVFSGTRGDHSVPYLRFILQVDCQGQNGFVVQLLSQCCVCASAVTQGLCRRAG